MSRMAVLKVEGRTLPEVWERAVILCWEKGVTFKTEYDKEGDPPSRDSTMIMVVAEPFGEPRIHRAIPAGLENLEIYRQEVLQGLHDDWVSGGEDQKWKYTYHERLFKYEVCGQRIDQIEELTKKLSKSPHTRRAQAVTWKVWQDPHIDDPPCLQRLWFRISEDELILNVHIRSNDAYKAAFMNMFAFTEIQRSVAEKASQKIGREIKPGQYVHIADSFHIYGAYFEEFKGFLKTVEERSFKERTWSSDFAEPFFKQID